MAALLCGFLAVGALYYAFQSLRGFQNASRNIASRTYHQSLQSSLLNQLILSTADFLSNPKNCSCNSKFKALWQNVQVGSNAKLNWLAPNTTPPANLSSLSEEHQKAWQRCMTLQSTEVSGFLADPALIQDAATCTLKSNYTATSGYQSPTGIYFCLSLNKINPNESIDSSMANTQYAFAEARLEFTNTLHNSSLGGCRDFSVQLISQQLGGLTVTNYLTLYWANPKTDGTLTANQKSLVLSSPIEVDPPMRYIQRIFRDALGREPSFNEVLPRWRSYHELINAGWPDSSIRWDTAASIVAHTGTKAPPIEYTTKLIQQNGYDFFKIDSSNDGPECHCTGDCHNGVDFNCCNANSFAVHRAHLHHVGLPPDYRPEVYEPPYYCNGWEIYGEAMQFDPYNHWDYSLVFGQDFAGSWRAWDANKGGIDSTKCSMDNTVNDPATCGALCSNMINLSYKAFMGREPNAPPESASSEAHTFYQQCLGSPWKWCAKTNLACFNQCPASSEGCYLPGSAPPIVGASIAGSPEAMQYLVNQTFLKFMKRSYNSSTDASTAQKFFTGEERFLDFVTRILSKKEYFDRRP